MMRRHTILGLAALVVLAWAPRTAARPRFCLPPVFDGGQRLHPVPVPSVLWLELLLRQHELCWRQPATPDEVRIVVGGSSTVFGHPLPVEETFEHLLNRHFSETGIDAHLFNLAFVFPYQLRDAVIFHELLPYDPDVILYPITLQEFVHVAPAFFPPQLVRFFETNVDPLAALVNDPPPGLGEPLALYREVVAQEGGGKRWLDHFRELGLLLRVAAKQHARWAAQHLGSPAPVPPMRTLGRPKYDCRNTQQTIELQFQRWQEWSILGYLEDLRRTRGIEVLIINWPSAHDPIDDCYNARYSNAAMDEFNRWLHLETTTRNLPYLDLHDFLPADAFLDSMHLNATGQRLVAARLAEVLDPLAREIAARKHPRNPR